MCLFTATVAAMYYSYYMLPDGTYCLAPPPPGIDVATYYNALPAGVTVSSTTGVATVPPPPGTTPPPPPDTTDSSSALTSTTTSTRYQILICCLIGGVSFLHFNMKYLVRVLLLVTPQYHLPMFIQLWLSPFWSLILYMVIVSHLLWWFCMMENEVILTG